MNIWLVMRMRPAVPDRWDVMGVFDDHAKAVAACSTEYDVLFPLLLNHVLPDDDVPAAYEWPLLPAGEGTP